MTIPRTSARSHATYRARRALALTLPVLATGGCSERQLAGEPLARQQEPIIYGQDDRREVFEGGAATAAASRGTFAIVESGVASFLEGKADAGSPPTLREAARLCEDERFAEQPSFALCTGTALTPTLAVTAAHCLGGGVDTTHWLSNFGLAPDAGVHLPGDFVVHTVQEVVHKEQSLPGEDFRVDFAVVRLSPPLPTPPAVLAARAPFSGQVVTTVGASAGLPLKITDGEILAVRRAGDYFDFTGDVFAGGSGSGVYDQAGELLGIHARGGVDYEWMAKGCRKSRVVDAGSTSEQATPVWTIIERTCRVRPGLEFCSWQSTAESEDAGLKPAVDPGQSLGPDENPFPTEPPSDTSTGGSSSDPQRSDVATISAEPNDPGRVGDVSFEDRQSEVHLTIYSSRCSIGRGVAPRRHDWALVALWAVVALRRRARLCSSRLDQWL